MQFSKKIIILTNVKRIEKGAFSEELKYIGDFAFSFCKNLRRVELPKNLIYIGDYEFQFCEKLEYIYIPESVEYYE